ncbi:uncharacterized protein BJX67DRAFT_385856 [Aspergillus lucknowensis]|uniref:Uncharacterized protein n=1 Tax=Aspergillus lucknowensis TaxID=176173 RepID=A0ABR4LCY2_9EURO
MGSPHTILEVVSVFQVPRRVAAPPLVYVHGSTLVGNLRNGPIYNQWWLCPILKFCEVCEKGVQQEDYDPFIFLCSSVSDLLHGWVVQGFIYFRKIREIEAKVLALGKSFDRIERHGSNETREIERKNLRDARNLMLQLHELCSYQVRHYRNLGYLSNIINESVKEHDDMREALGINLIAFLEVHKNLCTLAPWVQGMKQNLESAQKVTDSCLSTLSLLLNMRNSHSVEENTKFLATMAEYSSKEITK